MLPAGQTHGSLQPLCAFSTLDRGERPRALRGSVNKAARLPAGRAQPVKGKKSGIFRAACFGNASGRDDYPDTLGLAFPRPRVSSDRGPVLERAGRPAGRGREPVPQSPGLQSSRGEDHGHRHGRPLGDLRSTPSPRQEPTQPRLSPGAARGGGVAERPPEAGPRRNYHRAETPSKADLIR